MRNIYGDHFSKMKKSRAVKKSDKRVKAKKVKKKSEVSVTGALFSTLFTCVVVGYLLFPQELTQYFGRIEVGLFSNAGAQTAPPKEENTDQNKVEKGAENSAQTKEASAKKKEDRTPAYAKDVSYFSKLQEKEGILKTREEGLVQLEEDLQRQKEELEVKIAELKKLRGEISTLLKDRVESDEKKLMKLVDFYSTMKPQRAAQIINSLDEDLAVSVLDKMKKKNAAAILNLVDPLKAQTLSEKFAEYKK